MPIKGKHSDTVKDMVKVENLLLIVVSPPHAFHTACVLLHTITKKKTKNSVYKSALSSSPTWCSYPVPGHTRLHSETLSQKQTKKKIFL